MDNSRIAGFARLVVETANDGDKIAVEILKEAGIELGTAAVAVIKKLHLEDQAVPIGCVGSVFMAGRLLTDPMRAVIAAVAPKARLADPLMPPSHAAALMALQNGNNGSKR
jgi:N-acetylglucosamine kinase-like BadF-type ATPase